MKIYIILSIICIVVAFVAMMNNSTLGSMGFFMGAFSFIGMAAHIYEKKLNSYYTNFKQDLDFLK